MSRIRLNRFGVLVALAGVAPRFAAAQNCSAAVPTGSCTVSTTTTMTAGTVLQLTLSASSTALTAPATADYDAGFVANNGPTATVRANRSWTLRIASSAATWTATSTQPGVTARANKPAADLQWSTSPAGSFVGLAVVGAAAAGAGATSGTTTSIYFHTLYNWTLDTPGNYSLAVVFTLSAP